MFFTGDTGVFGTENPIFTRDGVHLNHRAVQIFP